MPKDVGGLTRREFLGRSFGAAAAGVLVSGAEEEAPVKSLYDVPGVSVKEVKWMPEDITDKVTANPDYAKIFEKDSGGTQHSPNREWFVEGFVETREFFHKQPEVVDSEGNRYHGHFLYDRKGGRVYHLESGDDGVNSFVTQVTNKGACAYSTMMPTPSGNGKIYVIADIGRLRKIVLRPDGMTFGDWSMLDPELSNNSNALYFNVSTDHYLFDLATGKVMSQGEGPILGMNDDASFLAIFQNDTYMRLNVKTGEVEFAFRHTNTKYTFEISPDGNFVACGVSPQGLEVRVFSDDVSFYISRNDQDYVWSIDNEGTLQATSGTYRYKDGMYHWTTPGKEKPEGLRIVKF
ncbi:MAG: twin-arginine translocation signal domain-containing protein [Candidatus Woesearchaeota archaeon]